MFNIHGRDSFEFEFIDLSLRWEGWEKSLHVNPCIVFVEGLCFTVSLGILVYKDTDDEKSYGKSWWRMYEEVGACLLQSGFASLLVLELFVIWVMHWRDSVAERLVRSPRLVLLFFASLCHTCLSNEFTLSSFHSGLVHLFAHQSMDLLHCT